MPKLLAVAQMVKSSKHILNHRWAITTDRFSVWQFWHSALKSDIWHTCWSSVSNFMKLDSFSSRNHKECTLYS